MAVYGQIERGWYRLRVRFQIVSLLGPLVVGPSLGFGSVLCFLCFFVFIVNVFFVFFDPIGFAN